LHFELPELPYAADALEPFISERTVFHHYEKHHQGYLDKLRNALGDVSATAGLPLEHIVTSADGQVFNLAAQVWNHNFYWQSLTPERMDVMDAGLKRLLDRSFGGIDRWKREFAAVAAAEFGSGWAWLAYSPQEDSLSVFSTTDAVTPLVMDVVPLLTLDVWEHAYYLDYQQERGAYIDAFVDRLVNWEFAAARLSRARDES
jgi:Fe-Mn family superoxide dismutase